MIKVIAYARVSFEWEEWENRCFTFDLSEGVEPNEDDVFDCSNYEKALSTFVSDMNAEASAGQDVEIGDICFSFDD